MALYPLVRDLVPSGLFPCESYALLLIKNLIFLIAKLTEFRKDMTKIKFFRMKATYLVIKN